MPQPRKSQKSQQRTTPAKQRATPAKRRAARSPAAADSSASRDEALRKNLAALRELLTRSVVVTGDRIQDAVDDAVKRGRMTRADAEELVTSLVAAGRKQTEELLAEVEALLGRGRDGAEKTGRRARSRVEAATRRAPGTDHVLQQVDRARRAAGLGSSFPITGYDDLTAAQVTERLGELEPAELRKVREHERRNANRKSVLAAIEKKLD